MKCYNARRIEVNLSKINIMHLKDSSGIFGSERVILTLGKNIDRGRYNFILLCMRRKDGRSEKLIAKARQIGIDVIAVDVNGRFDFRALAGIRGVLREKSIAVLHTHDFKSDFYGILASINLGIKKVTTAHGSTRDSLLKRAYLFVTEHFIYRGFDRIIAVSEDICLQLQKKHIKRECIEVIQNGIDLSLISAEMGAGDGADPISLPKGPEVFAVIGRIFPDKGHRVFLHAFSKALKNYQSIMALIVGDGPAKDEIVRQVQELKLENHVHLCGVRSDMKNVYDRIDFLVIPSLREGLPYVLLEAMASKVPVLATAVGDIPVLIEDNVTGYLVPPGDIDALEKGMTELLTKRAKAKQMAERAYRLVTEKFSEQRMVRNTENLYRSFLLFNKH